MKLLKVGNVGFSFSSKSSVSLSEGHLLNCRNVADRCSRNAIWRPRAAGREEHRLHDEMMMAGRISMINTFYVNGSSFESLAILILHDFVGPSITSTKTLLQASDKTAMLL